MGDISGIATSASRNSLSFALWLDDVMSQRAEPSWNDCHLDGCGWPAVIQWEPVSLLRLRLKL